MHAANLLSIFLFLACFFTKATRCFGYHFGQPFQCRNMAARPYPCFQAKTTHWIACKYPFPEHPFPTVTTYLVMNMHTPPPSLVLHPAYRLSTISRLPIKRFFICSFGDLDLLFSAHHLGCPSRTNLCVPPQVPCFGESCLTLATRIVVRQFVEICDQ